MQLDTLAERINYALAFFQQQGWSLAQAAGVVANLHAESKVDPSQAQLGGGPGYGIAQWEAARQADFKAWAGHDIHGTSLPEQLGFVQYELNHTQKAAGAALIRATTPSEAAAIVCRLYERPADVDGQSAMRATQAEVIYSKAKPDFSNVQAGVGSTAPKVA